MTGKYKGYLRIRVGALRILFFIENEDIVISAIGFRGGIY
jgi:mRNA-degrading endonuclease RelE of RelBE toxin-antitoxin system